MKGNLAVLMDVGGYKLRCGIIRKTNNTYELLKYVEKKLINIQSRSKFGLVLNGGKVLNPGAFKKACEDIINEDSLLKGLEPSEITKLKEAYFVLPGLAFNNGTHKETLDLGGPNCKVSEFHLKTIVRNAVSTIPMDNAGEKLAHQIVSEYALDSNPDPIYEPPMNKTAKRLHINMYYSRISSSIYDDYINDFGELIPKNNIHFLSQPVVIGNYVNSQLMTEKPALIIHMGHTVTEVIILHKNKIQKIWSFRWAGKNINSDISNYFNGLPYTHADRLKRDSGSAYIKGTTQLDDIVHNETLSTGKQSSINKGMLTKVIQAKSEDIFIYIAKILKEYVSENSIPITDIYLTGGQSQIEKLETLVRDIIGFETSKPRIDLDQGHINYCGYEEEFPFHMPEYYSFIAALHHLKDKRDHYIHPRKYKMFDHIRKLMK